MLPRELFLLSLFIAPCHAAILDFDDPITIMMLIFIGLIFIAIGCLVGWMHYVNKHGKKKEQEKVYPWYIYYPLFFVKYLLLELIALVYTILGIIGLETNDWGSLNINPTRICFYILTVLKYALLIGMFLLDNKFEHKKHEITRKFRLRPDWPELLDALIFTPTVIVDGLLINAEFSIDDTGDIFDYDSATLIILDTMLYTKLMLSTILRINSEDGKYQYDIVGVLYALHLFFYGLLLTFLMILVHLNAIPETGMKMTASMWLCLIFILTHNYACTYSSYIAQNITYLDKALKGTQLRVSQLKYIIGYFRRTPLAYVLNILGYGYGLFVYIVVFVLLGILTASVRPEPILQVGVASVLLLLTASNIFMICNWAFAVLKRIGIKLPCPLGKPFTCEKYAVAVNTILNDCTANFRMDTDMQVRGGNVI